LQRMIVRTVVVKAKLGEEGERRKGEGDRKEKHKAVQRSVDKWITAVGKGQID
jgi:hypothetical protein